MSRQSLFENERLAAEAAEWFVRLNQMHVPMHVRQDFVEWMLRSSAHLAAYLEVSHASGELAGLEDLPSRAELVAAAKADKTQDNVVEFRSAYKRDRGAVTCPRRVRRRRPFRYATAASVLVAILSVGAIALQFSHARNHLQTAVGEQRSVVLDEGSTVLLNTDSDLSLAFSKGERRIELKRGEARFTVAKDPNRPFIVVTPEATVRALGTIFNVHIGSNGTEVSVIEGRVGVEQRKADARLLTMGNAIELSGEATHLSIGEQAAVPRVGAIHSGPTEPLSNALAWPRHQISFHDKTLADLVAEFNRYHKRPIVIADSELATHEVDGTFDAFDHDSLLDYLERYQGVRVDRQENGEIVLRRKP